MPTHRPSGVLAQTGLTFGLSTASGKLMRTIMAGLAEFERDLIRERVKSGLAGAKSASAPGADSRADIAKCRSWAKSRQFFRRQLPHTVHEPRRVAAPFTSLAIANST
jgi:hypothetical protein